MIQNYFITGDKHGNFHSILQNELVKSSDNAIIILGDHGFNYYLNKYDNRLKKEISQNSSCIWYCARGNHCARPQNIPGMQLVYDSEVNGKIYMEERFPNIRYFCDEGGIYDIAGRKTLVIPGAYSVDKWYRLQNGWNWFPNEQLTLRERQDLEDLATGQHFDLVLSHTCPYSYIPTDLFLRGIDQSQVDNTMERWMDRFMGNITFNIHLWGHFHADRIEAPHREMFMHKVELLDDIEARWKIYDETGELDWRLPLSPKMKRIMEKE